MVDKKRGRIYLQVLTIRSTSSPRIKINLEELNKQKSISSLSSFPFNFHSRLLLKCRGDCSQRRLSPPLGSGFGIRPLPAEWVLKHHSSSMGDNLRTRRISLNGNTSRRFTGHIVVPRNLKRHETFK